MHFWSLKHGTYIQLGLSISKVVNIHSELFKGSGVWEHILDHCIQNLF